MVICFSKYYTYILTNYTNSVLYVGVTNNLARRLFEHKKSTSKTFVGRYNIYKLIYWEEFSDINLAIQREKQIKKWRRKKKEKLIRNVNPGYLNLSYYFGKDKIV